MGASAVGGECHVREFRRGRGALADGRGPARGLSLLGVALAGLSMTAACGGTGDGRSQSGTKAAHTRSVSSTVSEAADQSGRLRFTRALLAARAGRVTIVFTNASPVPHNLTLEQPGTRRVLGATSTFSRGKTHLTLTLPPGRYSFYCSIPGHRAAGMHGTLVVR